MELSRIPRAILAAIVLHNLAIDMRLPDPEDGGEEDDQPPPFNFSELLSDPRWASDRQARNLGAQRRNEIAARFA